MDYGPAEAAINPSREEQQTILKLIGSQRFSEERAQLKSELDTLLDSEETSINQRELDDARRELRKLKLEVASVLEGKAKAEKEVEASKNKARMCSSYIEQIKKEIDEANEDQVLIELARVEAERELRDIMDRRASEAARFSAAIREAKMRIKEHRVKIRRAKEHEKMLAVTTSDVNVLQNELELLRAMDCNFSASRTDKKNEELQDQPLLVVPEPVLEAAKVELAYFKEQVFQLMASMDLVRTEIMQVIDESAQLAKLNKKTDSVVQHLNSKLLKAKSKFESASSAEERIQAIVTNLSSALQQLQTDITEDKEKEELANNEAEAIKVETEKINQGIDSMEAILQASIEELKAVKASEAATLAELSFVSKQRMMAIDRSSVCSSTITISKFEYEYLRSRAEGAQDVADEKVAAAQLWVEALDARERELLLESQILQREMEEFRLTGESEESESGSDDEEEAKPLEMLQFEVAKSRIRKGKNGVVVGESRRMKTRRSSVSSRRRRSSTSHPPTFVVKKRTVMNKFVGFLKGRS